MAGNIKGITIEFRGETTKLDKALKDVNKETSQIDKELKDVNKLLKFNPKNTELLAQKQQLLSDKIKQTTDKLDLLKRSQKTLDDSGAVDKNSSEYRKLQREIIETESKLKTFKGQLKEVANTKLTQLSTEFDKIHQKTKVLSGAAAGLAGALLFNGFRSVQQADEIATLANQYNVTTDAVQEYNYASELVDVSTDTLLTSHAKLTRQIGAENEAFNTLGVSLVDSSGQLRAVDDIWWDTIAALSRVDNETQRDILTQELFGRSYAELAGVIDDGGEALRRYSEEAHETGAVVDKDLIQRSLETSDKLEKLKKILEGDLLTAGLKLAEALAPVLAELADLVANVVTWFSELDGTTQVVILIFLGLVAAISPVAGIISSILGVVTLLPASFTAMLGPIGLVIAAVAAVIAIFVYLYNHSEKFRELVGIVVEKVKEIILGMIARFIAIKDTIVNVYDAIAGFVLSAIERFQHFKERVGEIVENVKQKWEDMKQKISDVWDWITGIPGKVADIVQGIREKIKLPHFSLTGDLSLIPPRVPHVNVEWYANGGIFSSPTIAGIGEAGPEAVVPLDKFWKKLEQLNGGGDVININVYGTEGQSVTDLAREVKRMLIQAEQRRSYAW